MSERSVIHDTFVLERGYPVTRARVFAAWADPEAKRRWFAGPEEKLAEFEFDFRVGGRELSRGENDDKEFTYDCRYMDIVPDERIVYSYDMHIDGIRISISLATVELRPDEDGTLLIYTEQAAFLDGYDDPSGRRSGMGSLLDALGKELERRS